MARISRELPPISRRLAVALCAGALAALAALPAGALAASAGTATPVTPAATPSAGGTAAPGVPAATTPTATTTTPAAVPGASRGHGSGRLSTAAIVLAAVAALLALCALAWALARSQAYEPRWWQSLRHSLAEAGFRASATWSEFADWARLGR